MSAFRLADFLPYQLSVASNAVSRAVAEGTGYMVRFGLSATEWRVLAAISAAGAPTQAELLRATGIDKMPISRAVAALHKRAFIERLRNPDDRRTQRLRATAVGLQIHDEVAAEAVKVEAALLAALSPVEDVALRDILYRLWKACEKT